MNLWSTEHGNLTCKWSWQIQRPAVSSTVIGSCVKIGRLETAKIRVPVEQNSTVLSASQWLKAMVSVGSNWIHWSRPFFQVCAKLAAAEMRLRHRFRFEAKYTCYSTSNFHQPCTQFSRLRLISKPQKIKPVYLPTPLLQFVYHLKTMNEWKSKKIMVRLKSCPTSLALDFCQRELIEHQIYHYTH